MTSIHPSSRFALREISLLTALACGAGFAAQAQTVPAAVQVAALKEIVVSGSRGEQSLSLIHI